MLRAYAQLLRLPNVFTAWADVTLGVSIATYLCARTSQEVEIAWCAVAWAASTCFYWAGMVLNDVFDAEEDARERPFRPIPSGRVSKETAAWLGGLLLTAGLALAWSRAAVPFQWAPLQASLALAALIVFYNIGAKRTLLGPFVMGGCRFVHLLLIVIVVGATLKLWVFGLAAIVGGYISIVTFVARDEANNPRIQRAVKSLLLGLIPLDALLATLIVGWPGLLILLLLPPALLLGRWVYST